MLDERIGGLFLPFFLNLDKNFHGRPIQAIVFLENSTHRLIIFPDDEF